MRHPKDQIPRPKKTDDNCEVGIRTETFARTNVNRGKDGCERLGHLPPVLGNYTQSEVFSHETSLDTQAIAKTLQIEYILVGTLAGFKFVVSKGRRSVRCAQVGNPNRKF